MKRIPLVAALLVLVLPVPHASRAVGTLSPAEFAASSVAPGHGDTEPRGGEAVRPLLVAQTETNPVADTATGSPDIPTAVLRTRFADSPPVSTVPENFFGLHENLLTQTDGEADLAAQLDRLRELNLGVLRFSVSWKKLFDAGPDCSRNTPNEAGIRKLNDLLARLPARVEVLGILSQPPQSCANLYERDRAAFRRQFADYVAKAVTMFKHRIAAWDVWNEPNGNRFYLSPPGRNMWTGGEYFEDIVHPGATTIRRIDPGAIIVLGSVAGNGVEGHRCRPNGTIRGGRPCPPPPGTGWYMSPDFFSNSSPT